MPLMIRIGFWLRKEAESAEPKALSQRRQDLEGLPMDYFRSAQVRTLEAGSSGVEVYTGLKYQQTYTLRVPICIYFK